MKGRLYLPSYNSYYKVHNSKPVDAVNLVALRGDLYKIKSDEDLSYALIAVIRWRHPINVLKGHD